MADGWWGGGADSDSRRSQRGFDVDKVRRRLGQLPDALFDLRIKDQDHLARVLGEGAVTTEPTPVLVCRAHLR
jgi:hypothetical protein